MSVSATRITVTTTATLLASGPVTVYLEFEAAGIILGDSSVTATTGYTLPSTPIPFVLHGGDSLYGIVASGSVVCEVLKIS